ncbi:sensor domain-containing diguanylate cyclase [Ramlibacter sp. MMS24-I3-19]|uniref:sensor domain-containing diguanylate cyclase n=1 Tax=Ramlibacter sp. MMS24-I3-19 TaxID=3416606 RepID=UPI003CFE11FD
MSFSGRATCGSSAAMGENRPVPQLILRACFALLCVLLTATARADSAPDVATVQPGVIVLDPSQGSISLAGKAQVWIERGQGGTVGEIAAAGDALGWQPLDGSRQYRLDNAALWVRFDVERRDAGHWFVTIGLSGTDRVQLFHRDSQGTWNAQEAGDSRPVSQWPLPGRVPTFELQGDDRSGPERFYLRIVHERVDFAAPLVLYSQGRLLAVREREQLLFGAYFGLSVLLMLVSLLNWVGYRDRLFGVYAVYLLCFTAGQASYVGAGAQHLWNDWLAWNAESTFILPALAAPAGLWFVHAVTEPARFSHALHRTVQLLVVVLLVAALLDPLLPTRELLAFRLALTGLSVPLVALLIGLVWRKGDDPDIRVIALGFVPVLVMALFPIARGLNLVPNSILTRYGLSMGGAMEMPILFYALSRRGSRRREGQLRASALPRTDALTGLADRRSLLQRMDAALVRARQQKHACVLLVAKVANLDAIAGDHGRDTLNRDLVVMASHLRRACSDVDTAARVGEREFALLLEGPTSAETATSRAQQLVASGLRPSSALPQELTLRVMVVMALLPDQQPDAETTLQWALDALAGVRPDSRKQIRPLNF